MGDRLSWDEYFSEISEVTAKRSSCDRLKVGCLLVDIPIQLDSQQKHLCFCPRGVETDQVFLINPEQF